MTMSAPPLQVVACRLLLYHPSPVLGAGDPCAPCADVFHMPQAEPDRPTTPNGPVSTAGDILCEGYICRAAVSPIGAAPLRLELP